MRGMRRQDNQLVRDAVEAAVVLPIVGYEDVKLTPRSELLKVDAKLTAVTPIGIGILKNRNFSALESYFAVSNRLEVDGFDFGVLPHL